MLTRWKKAATVNSRGGNAGYLFRVLYLIQQILKNISEKFVVRVLHGTASKAECFCGGEIFQRELDARFSLIGWLGRMECNVCGNRNTEGIF